MPVDQAQARREAFLARMNKGKETSSGLGLGFFKGNLEGVNFWKCKEGDHDIDIIPYLAGPFDPNTPEGEWTYILEVYEHRDVGGIEGQNYICLMKTYKQPCPVCEHRQMLIKEGGDEGVIKDLRPSRYPRSIYNILCYDDTKEEDTGIQVFHTSHYIMEMYLLKLAESTKRDIAAGDPPYKYFADPDDGYSVRFTRTGTGMNTRFIAHSLVARNYQINPEMLNAAQQLDTLIHIPEYEEVYKAFWGEELDPGVTAAQDQALGGRGGGGAAIAGGGSRVARGGGRGSQPEEQPGNAEAAYQTNAGDYVCPGGGTFGVDTYQLQHCENCELWEPCVQANEEAAGLPDDQQAAEQEQPGGRGGAQPAPAGRGAPTTGRGGGARGAAPAGRGGAQPAPAGRGGGAAPAGRGASPAQNQRPAGRGGGGKRSL